MPDYPHIEHYREELDRLIERGGSTNEQSTRRAFENCLDAYCRDHREKLALVSEIRVGSVRPDGVVKDSLRMARGYWEAKDTDDNLDAEIQRKLNRGYPRDNIIFEDTRTAVLYQNGGETMRVDMRRPDELHRLIRVFLDYELPEIQDFRKAQSQFKADLPTVLTSLRETTEDAERESAEYQAAAAAFLDLCKRTIGPNVSEADIREMLLQHILTKDIFLRVFGEQQFHRENNIARHLDALEQTFFTGDLRRQAIDRLRVYYGAIGRAADQIADYSEKQQFLKVIYEDFYKAYNPAAADRLGVVYTPNEVVDFMVRGADHLLRKHFGRGLADDNVQILDPATGTGTFITSLINFLPLDRLEHKYRNEMHANELAILPYYIANLNIEYTYRERTGDYLEFPNLCFVDTLDNMGWQQTGVTGTTVEQQSTLNLGAMSEENWIRIQEQNEKEISVIIGNPPYNANQQNENDKNKNREYPEIDRRIRDTYIEASTAQKTKQYDMYKRFIRWASDRLADEGIIAFVTNRKYLEARQDDGFRQVAPTEFSDLYLVDLGGDVRAGRPAGNVFGIMTGVAVGFFVRRSTSLQRGRVHYYALADEQSGSEKLELLRNLGVESIAFQEIVPDAKYDWLRQSDSGFDALIPLIDRHTKFAKAAFEEQALFGLYAPGVNTARDGWVYDFDQKTLQAKTKFFADTYNKFVDEGDTSYDTVIKWSEALRNRFEHGQRIIVNKQEFTHSLYRPFVKNHYFANTVVNERLTSNHHAIWGNELSQDNKVICLTGSGARRPFAVLATKIITDFHLFFDGTQCLPLYRYTEDGRRVSNITQWSIRLVNDHYRKEWGSDFEKVVGKDGITAEQIFAYTYAVLHDPVYRNDYEVDLRREFPRLPLYHDFDVWARMGQELLDLHVGFESAEPYPLKRVETGKEPGKPKLRADTEGGVIVLDDATRLTGVPPDAWRYRLGSRSALEWVLDQYKERKPRDPTIAARFDTYRFAHYKEHVIDLLRRVCTVSAQTMEIVDGMAYWDGDKLVVFGDRDKHELAMLGMSE